jgi:hypothetical protein
MEKNCKWIAVIAGILILLFLYLDNAASNWVIGIIAVLTILHPFLCKCGSCDPGTAPTKAKKK